MAAKKRQRHAMSRHRRSGLLLLAMAAVSACVWLDRHYGGGIRTEIVQHAHWGLDGLKYQDKPFAVVSVVDGDTLDLDVPDGPDDHTRVRLLGIDTPETKDPRVGLMYYGPEASAFAEALVDGKTVTVILDTVGDVRDIYGRLLAYIQLEDGRVLNEELLAGGFGYADLRFEHSYFDRYVLLQQQAMDKQAGLWKEVSRDQLPKWLQRERPDLPVRP
jgi:micrococcal nuclease